MFINKLESPKYFPHPYLGSRENTLERMQIHNYTHLAIDEAWVGIESSLKEAKGILKGLRARFSEK
jgi:hypothetical protein